MNAELISVLGYIYLLTTAPLACHPCELCLSQASKKLDRVVTCSSQTILRRFVKKAYQSEQ